MSGFGDREKSFEDKFKHDEDLQFRVVNRRNKLLGQWIAEQIGKSGEEAEAYAKEVVLADFDEPGDDDVVRKVMDDIRDAGLDLSEHRVRHRMEQLLITAKAEIMKE
ncbi:MAG: DUF1476 domain-containing protein [Rhodospirillales bacterium]|nr:DUF1476 domain-containing protein [Rhodospirillales bacterium]